MNKSSIALLLLAATSTQAAINYTFWNGNTNPNGGGNVATQGTVTDNGISTLTETLVYGAGGLGTSVTGVDFRGFTAASTNLDGGVPSGLLGNDHSIVVRQGDTVEIIRFQNASAGNHSRTMQGVTVWETAESGQSGLFNEIKLDFDAKVGAVTATTAVHGVVIAGGSTYVSLTGIPLTSSDSASFSIDATATNWQMWDFVGSGMNVTFGSGIAANLDNVTAVGLYISGSNSGSGATFTQTDISKFGVSPVPEPSVIALALGMLAAFLILRRRS